MSDFAKLLGKLESSANIAAVNSSSRKRQSSSRHPNKNNDEDEDNSNPNLSIQPPRLKKAKHSSNQKMEGPVSIRTPHVPRDIKDLSVKVSFLGIGAQKAGTSWLHKMLSVHEHLSLPEYVVRHVMHILQCFQFTMTRVSWFDHLLSSLFIGHCLVKCCELLIYR